MNQLNVGRRARNEIPVRGSFLYIGSDFPDPTEHRAQVFDPSVDRFNTTAHLDHIGARDLADHLYDLYPKSDTLRVRDGRRALARLLYDNALKRKRGVYLNHLASTTAPTDPGTADAIELLQDIFMSPVLDRVFGGSSTHTLNRNRTFASIDRSKHGRQDALAIAFALIASYRGPTIIEDLNFIGRDAHAELIHQDRLIAAVRNLEQLKLTAPLLHADLFLIEDIRTDGALYKDAVELAYAAGLRPDSLRANNPFNDFIDKAMQFNSQ